jgi:integrase
MGLVARMALNSRLTKRMVDALKPGEIAWDADVAGFGVRCQARAKTYVLKARVNGRQRWFTIGKHGSPWTIETARKEARSILGDVAKGLDPANARDRRKAERIAVNELIEDFMAQHVVPKRKQTTATHYGDILNRIVRPVLGKRFASDVTVSDVEKLHLSMKERPYQANRTVAVLSKMFAFAEKTGVIPRDTNPARGIEKFKEQGRERFLSSDEIDRLGAALLKAEEERLTTPHAIAALRLLLLTGARLSEILSLKWDYVDLERGLLLLPDSKTGRKPISLNAAAMDVLKDIPQIDGNPHVIVGHKTGARLVNLQKPWRRIRSIAGLDDVRIHDLRHTFASLAAASGASLPIIGKLLGHSQAATTQRYAHLTQDPLRETSQIVGNKIGDALSGRGEQ